MKKFAVGLGILGATLVAAPAAFADQGVDTEVRINAATAVPGGLTAGTWSVSNATAGTMPAGATYLVKFTRVQGGAILGTATVTTTELNKAKVQRISGDTFRITLTQPLLPGRALTGNWSDAHWIFFGQRDKVTISSENIPAGTVDTNSANDTATYDNSGQGF